jgi:hypothetical protein
LAQFGADQPRRLVRAESELTLQLQRCRWSGWPSDKRPRTRR